MMNIYLGTETNFNNNGIGFLKDCISANVTEVLNGEMILLLEYPLNTSISEYLTEDNIIKCNVGNDNYQLFRIKRTEKNFSTITVYAMHIFYDLLDNFIEDKAPTNLSCSSYIEWILNGTTEVNNFSAYSDISGTKSGRYVRRNPVECIMGDIDNSVLNLFNGELERDNFLIKVLSKRGSNNKVKLIFGKNIKEIQIVKDITPVFTKIMPIGYDGLLIPEKYVNSPIIGAYRTPKITKIEFPDIKYDPNDDEAYNTLEDAYQALRDATNSLYSAGIDKFPISIKINWLELSKTKEYHDKYSNLETVRIADTVTAEVLGLNYETRVIKTIYNVLTDTIDDFEIGTFKATLQNTINTLNARVEMISPSSILTEAQNKATQLIISAMGGNVYKTNSELFIMDTDNLNTSQKVWRWNLNGLGYSSTGYNGSYDLAMTIDGEIVADRILAGELNGALIKAGSISTQHLSIFLQNELGKIFSMETDIEGLHLQFMKKGNNILPGTDFKTMASWCGADIKPYYSGMFEPTFPSNGDYWYCTSTRSGYENGVIYVYNDKWIATDKTRKQLIEELSPSVNVEIIDNQETINNSRSGRFLRLNPNSIIMHKAEAMLISEDNITLSFNLKNFMSTGRLAVYIEQWNNNLYESELSQTGFVQRDIIYINKTNENNRYVFSIPITKHFITNFQNGGAAPTDISKYWLDSNTLKQYDENTSSWVNYTGWKKPLYDLNTNRFYVSSSGTSSYYIIASSILLSNPTYFSVGFSFTSEADSTPPVGYIDVYDIKAEYGSATDWSPNPNELSGANFSVTERGVSFKRGDNEYFYDEDEQKITYKNEVVQYTKKDETYNKRFRSLETNVDGLITKTANINFGSGVRKVHLSYDE